MKKVTFYLIENQKDTNDTGVIFYEKLACEKIAEAWQTKLRVLVTCQDQAQAERLDEYLWQLDTDNFVPHNLAGEGMSNGSPIEICWPQKRSNGNRQLLINLQQQFPEFSGVYRDVIDFVPVDQRLKSLARERYMAYKKMGFNLKTVPTLCK